MSQASIRKVFTNTLKAWATPKGILIARENQEFTKPVNNATFLELHIIPAETIVASVNAERKRYLGEVIIKLWVKNGEGTEVSETLAEELTAVFPVYPKTLFPVCVETIPSIKRPILDDSGYWITPICFSYRLEA